MLRLNVIRATKKLDNNTKSESKQRILFCSLFVFYSRNYGKEPLLLIRLLFNLDLDLIFYRTLNVLYQTMLSCFLFLYHPL